MTEVEEPDAGGVGFGRAILRGTLWHMCFVGTGLLMVSLTGSACACGHHAFEPSIAWPIYGGATFGGLILGRVLDRKTHDGRWLAVALFLMLGGLVAAVVASGNDLEEAHRFKPATGVQVEF